MGAPRFFAELLFLVSLVVLAQTTVSAQQADETDASSSLPFEVDARATAYSGYTTNVFSTDTDTKGDFITIVAPEIGISKKGDGYQLAVGASAEIGRYFDLTSENYLDGALRAEGRLEVLDGITLLAGGDYLWEHEARTSPDDVNGVEPTRYTDASLFAGVAMKFDPYALRLGVNYRHLDFDDVAIAGGGTANNDDRDRDHLELGARVGYAFMPGKQAFVQVVYDDRSYAAALDDNRFRRGSRGIQAAVGFAGEIGPVAGEVLVGGLFYDFEDARFEDLATLDAGARITWRPNPRTRLTATIERGVEETTIFGASSYVNSSAGARVDHRIAQDLSAFAYASFSQNDYQSIPRIDYVAEAGLGVRYFVTPNVYIGLQHAFESRNSDVAGADYTDHEFLLSVGADLDPAWNGDPTPASFGMGGFYVGGQLSDGALLTSVFGPRGSGGTLAADFGDFGMAGGVFGGYRVDANGFVLGLEAEADLGGAEWSHEGNRTFSVERKNSVGLSGVVGFRTRNDVLLYGRAGIASADFDATTSRGEANNRASLSERRTGARIGIGAEFPVADGLSGRIEYIYANFGDIVLGAPRGRFSDDIFNNAEMQARFGLVYDFGATPRSAPKPVDFSGFYVGAQVGHEVLASDNTGPRQSGSDVSFTLDATRAGDGFDAGLFFGYGTTLGDFYVGAEAEAEIANTNWTIDRDPTGRVYSTEKLGSLGASLRAGYVLNDSVLVYLRGGPVVTRFETEYAVGGSVTSESETLGGVRFGGGAEVAISDRMRMRLDYTRSAYPDHSLSYPTGTDRFDPSESLFRVGVILDL